MEWFCHEVICQSEARDGALDSFDHRRRVPADAVEFADDRDDERVQFPRALEVAGFRCGVEAHVKPGENVRAAIYPAMSAEQHGFREQLFRAGDERPVRALSTEFQQAVEVTHVAGAVLQAHHARLLHRPLHDVQFERHLRQGRHVVEEEGQGKLGDEAVEILAQFRLAFRQVVGRGEHHGIRTRLGGAAGDPHGFDKRGVSDADQHRHAVLHDLAGGLDDLAAQAITQARSFAGRPKDEQSFHSTGQQVLQDTFEPRPIQRIAV